MTNALLPGRPIAAALLLLAVLALGACGRRAAQDAGGLDVELYRPAHASGFEIRGGEGRKSSLVVTRSPWQGAEPGASTSLFIARGGEEPPAGFTGQVIRGDASRIVCMSSSHVAVLDALGLTSRIVGVSGRGFLTNPSVRARGDSVADVGYDGNIDYEALMAARPQLVLLYGVSGSCRMEPKLKQLGIPYMYVGEYLEEDPLGKAEWMVALGEVAGMRSEAARRFEAIPREYARLKAMADTLGPRPSVMLNTPYGDSWVMPSTSSCMARLIADAGGEYAYSRDTSNRSCPIDMEEAYTLASRADVWLNVGRISSLAELRAAYPKFAASPAVAGANVWNCDLRSTPGGGNDFWEGGVANPQLVLRDLIKIFHPGALPDAPFTYYRRLE